jgi:hydrogenase maturation protease
MQTQCLFRSGEGSKVEVEARFLQPVTREIGVLPRTLSSWDSLQEPVMDLVPVLEVDGNLYQGWHEAIERGAAVTLRLGGGKVSVRFSWPMLRTMEPIRNRDDQLAGMILRHHPPIEGVLEAEADALDAHVYRVSVRVTNRSFLPDALVGDAEEVLLRTFTSTHAVLTSSDGEFLSLTDPPPDYAAATQECRNIGAWPVLVGDQAAGERDTLLASPIILADYPQIAAESPGPLFDGTEIDEILNLRILTMTDEEKREMRNVDEQARRILKRAEGMSGEGQMTMHGAMRRPSPAEQVFGGNSRLESARVGDAEVRAGARVRLRPRGRADIMDLALAGRAAVIEAVEQDAEGRVHFAVVIEDDPGRDLGMLRQPGHRFFFGVDEVEVLGKEGPP